MTTAKDTELDLYRSGLLNSAFNQRHLTLACKAIAKDLNRIARHRLNACNGIERWDAKIGRRVASWTEEDQAIADRETEESRETIKRTLLPFLIRGTNWDWKEDPRCGYVLRITDKANRRDVWLG